MAKQKNKLVDPNTVSASLVNRRGQFLLDAIIDESQRGQVLIATAFLDDALRGCILAMCKKQDVDGGVALRLLGDRDEGGRAILADFGAKIPICRAFGVINQPVYEALEAVRKIRNLCAHSDFKVTFRHKEIKGHVGTLRAWIKSVEHKAVYAPAGKLPIPSWIRDLNLVGKVVQNPPSAQHIFLGATIMLWTILHNIRWAIHTAEYNNQAILITKGTHGLYD